MELINSIPILSISQIAKITRISPHKLYKINSGARDNLTDAEQETLRQLNIKMLELLDQF